MSVCWKLMGEGEVVMNGRSVCGKEALRPGGYHVTRSRSLALSDHAYNYDI